MTNLKQMNFLSLTFLAASLAPPALAQPPKPTLTEFDAPGAATVSSPACASALGCGTVAFANNDQGQIVGFYTDTNVVAHGFLRSPKGEFTSFDVPGAGLGAGLDQGTVAYAINDQGAMAEPSRTPATSITALCATPMAPSSHSTRRTRAPAQTKALGHGALI